MFPLLFAAAMALAQDPEAVAWEAPAPAEADGKAVTDLSAEFGGSYTTGNSVAFTSYGALTFGVTWSKNKLGAVFNGTVSRSYFDANGDGFLDDTERDAGFKTTTNRYGGELRYDRVITPRGSLYALVGGYRDPFAGFDYRIHEQIGYSRTLVDLKRTVGEGDDAVDLKTKLLVELGIDFAQEDYTEGVDPNNDQYLAGRLLVGFTHQFNPSTSFAEEVQVYENFFDTEDLRVINKLTLSSKLADKLSLKLSHNLVFYNRPVDERFKKVDQTVLVTFVASIL